MKFYIITDHSDQRGSCFEVQEVRPVSRAPIGYAAAFTTREFCERYVHERDGVICDDTAGLN